MQQRRQITAKNRTPGEQFAEDLSMERTPADTYRQPLPYPVCATSNTHVPSARYPDLRRFVSLLRAYFFQAKTLIQRLIVDLQGLAWYNRHSIKSQKNIE